MTKTERQPYEVKAKEDLERYRQEKAEFVRRSGRPKEKAKNAPKSPFPKASSHGNDVDREPTTIAVPLPVPNPGSAYLHPRSGAASTQKFVDGPPPRFLPQIMSSSIPFVNNAAQSSLTSGPSSVTTLSYTPASALHSPYSHVFSMIPGMDMLQHQMMQYPQFMYMSQMPGMYSNHPQGLLFNPQTTSSMLARSHYLQGNGAVQTPLSSENAATRMVTPGMGSADSQHPSSGFLSHFPEGLNSIMLQPGSQFSVSVGDTKATTALQGPRWTMAGQGPPPSALAQLQAPLVPQPIATSAASLLGGPGTNPGPS